MNTRLRGFTLIELLIVIAIIGILASALFANFSSVRERGRDSRRKQDLSQIKNALRMYYNDHQSFPETFSFKVPFSDGDTMYMQDVPQDPLYDARAYVYLFEDSDTYRLSAELENPADASAQESQRRCGLSPDEESATYYVCE